MFRTSQANAVVIQQITRNTIGNKSNNLSGLNMAYQPRNFSLSDWTRARPLIYLSDYLNGLIQGRLWLKVLIGMFAGIIIGIILGPSIALVETGTAVIIGNWLALPGQLFLILIQMIVIPLVFASVIRGITASGDIDLLRKLGLRTGLYFIATTAVAISLGMFVALTLKPGQFIDTATVQQALAGSPVVIDQQNLAPPSLSDLPQQLLTLLPSNPLTSMVEGQMLQVLLFAIIIGIAMVMMSPSQSKPLLDVMASLQEVCMTIVRIAMRLAPFAVFGLIAQLTTKIGLNALLGMAFYVGTVLAGLGLLLIFYMLLIVIIGRISPLHFFRSAREAMLLAFSTSSSAAVMPITLRTAEEELKVRSSTAQFIIPLGATINMDGTALYQGVAAIFLAQVFGVDIGLGGMLLIVITAVGASIGSPATPGVGIVILATVLNAVGIPLSGIALIMGVDRILDMCRTAVNVCGDMVAARNLDHLLMQHEQRQRSASVSSTAEVETEQN
jgi:Na+/H+-dicarboxylate symporter